MTRSRSRGRRFGSHPPAAHKPESKGNPTSKRKTKKDRALAVMSVKSTRPVPPVRLRRSIACFSIPLIRAELVMDESLTNLGTLITYSAPQEVVAVDFDTRMEHTTCRVPVMEGGQLRGYVPLPMRYRDVWLELSYNIVLLINIWRLWSKEEGKALNSKEKRMATACRQNAGTLLVQYMLARLLAVEELVGLNYNTEPGEECVKVLNEWKVRMVRDWFYTTHSEAKADGPEFLHADPVSLENKAFFEMRWDIEEEGRDIMSLPADTNLWIHGRIEGFDDAFEKTIKPQSFEEMSKPSQFFETRYEEGAKLPSRWHEGHEPRPLFWSIKQWDWFRNDYWNAPIDLLRYVLVTEPAYHDVGQFLSDLRSLSSIISINPNWQDIEANAKDLWLGKMIWRKFVGSLRRSLNLSKEQTATSETRDDRNPFNTLEARLIFEGYMRRGKMNSKVQSTEDDTLWEVLNQIGPPEHLPVWKWVASEIQLHGSMLTEVLNKAGAWWRDFRYKQAKSSHVETHSTEQTDEEESNAGVDTPPEIATQVHDQQEGGSENVDALEEQNSESSGDACPHPDGGHPSGATSADNSTASAHPTALHNFTKPKLALPPALPATANTTTTVQVLETRESQRQELHPIHLSLSSDFEEGVGEFVKDLQRFPVEQLTVDLATPILDSFVRRVKAIQAKKEAWKSEKVLL
ncbi:hypothetical protein DFJ58DRAFT_843330 [Suillus subalutaceus]|uniref:uncharacterized protein n=1 Tax=Suillus subalutaceus TaxID=48586 RepID=UPI001B8622B2|nr:uncharacterized protein DFJ58DRAFT_843330 [Suillus subalutaceus]KAG1847013.1 hypothetical protein DFJ58DRAFT_843330 [Suillus subalutaceus]